MFFKDNFHWLVDNGISQPSTHGQEEQSKNCLSLNVSFLELCSVFDQCKTKVILKLNLVWRCRD